MTGLEKIVDEIRNAALTESNSIVDEAKAESEKLLSANKAKVDSQCEDILQRAEKEAEGVKGRSTSNAQLQYSQSKLSTKQQLIRETLLKSKEHLLGLPSDQYFDFLLELGKKVDQAGEATISFSEKDSSRLPGDFLEKFGNNLSLSLSPDPAKIEGGFILSFGNVTVDCSIESIFDQYENQLSDKINQVLFD